MVKNRINLMAFVIVLLTVIIQGCTSVQEKKQTLKNSFSCCNTLSELVYHEVPISFPFDASITNNSTIYSFESGNSYLSAFKLTSSDNLKNIHFKLNASGMTKITENTFCPKISFLDQNFNKVQSSNINIEWQKPGFVNLGHWLGTQQIPKSASYFIIHTTDELLTRQLPITQNDETYIVNGVVVNVPGGSGIQCAPTGKILILGIE
jgi:hypothetical protein